MQQIFVIKEGEEGGAAMKGGGVGFGWTVNVINVLVRELDLSGIGYLCEGQGSGRFRRIVVTLN
jgi:hypothetical protein